MLKVSYEVTPGFLQVRPNPAVKTSLLDSSGVAKASLACYGKRTPVANSCRLPRASCCALWPAVLLRKHVLYVPSSQRYDEEGNAQNNDIWMSGKVLCRYFSVLSPTLISLAAPFLCRERALTLHASHATTGEAAPPTKRTPKVLGVCITGPFESTSCYMKGQPFDTLD